MELAPTAVHRWSTDQVPASQRFDYFADALSTAIVPMRATSHEPATFGASMSALDLGPVSLVHQTGTPHRSFRRRADVARSGEHSYHLIVNLQSQWNLSHRHDSCLGPGDAVLTDSHYPHDLEMPCDYEVVHLKIAENWLHRWVAAPHALVGRRLPRSASWGAALSAYVSCLTPEAMAGASLAAGTVIDQVGTLLALVAGEFGGTPRRGLDAALRDRIGDAILQHCSMPDLSAATIADALQLPVESVHETLMAAGETFAGVLARTRRSVAMRMLSAPMFRSLSLAEIAARAGFASAAKMRQAVRRGGGEAPLPREPRDGSS